MSKSKLSKIIARIAIIGASAGAFLAIYVKYRKISNELKEQDEYEEDFDNFDFDKIDKDATSRDYVSININERKSSSEEVTDESK